MNAKMAKNIHKKLWQNKKIECTRQPYHPDFVKYFGPGQVKWDEHKQEITSFTCSSTRSNPLTAYWPGPYQTIIGIPLVDVYGYESDASETAPKSPEHAPLSPEHASPTDDDLQPAEALPAPEEELPTPAISTPALPDPVSPSDETEPFEEDDGSLTIF
ncbi:hypothetical protein Tco_0489666 [Tanacetum coccineum]